MKNYKRTLYNIRYRCNNPKDKKYKYYGGRGIKCFLSTEDITYLWNRDKAILMKNPSINRIDNDGNYELSNCEFIEMELNRIQRRRKNKVLYKPHNFIWDTNWETRYRALKSKGWKMIKMIKMGIEKAEKEDKKNEKRNSLHGK